MAMVVLLPLLAVKKKSVGGRKSPCRCLGMNTNEVLIIMFSDVRRR